jgi:hypothetical protein
LIVLRSSCLWSCSFGKMLNFKKKKQNHDISKENKIIKQASIWGWRVFGREGEVLKPITHGWLSCNQLFLVIIESELRTTSFPPRKLNTSLLPLHGPPVKLQHVWPIAPYLLFINMELNQCPNLSTFLFSFFIFFKNKNDMGILPVKMTGEFWIEYYIFTCLILCTKGAYL